MATLWERLYESGQLGRRRGQKRDGGVPRERLEHTGRAFPDGDKTFGNYFFKVVLRLFLFACLHFSLARGCDWQIYLRTSYDHHLTHRKSFL